MIVLYCHMPYISNLLSIIMGTLALDAVNAYPFRILFLFPADLASVVFSFHTVRAVMNNK